MIHGTSGRRLQGQSRVETVFRVVILALLNLGKRRGQGSISDAMSS